MQRHRARGSVFPVLVLQESSPFVLSEIKCEWGPSSHLLALGCAQPFGVSVEEVSQRYMCFSSREAVGLLKHSRIKAKAKLHSDVIRRNRGSQRLPRFTLVVRLDVDRASPICLVGQFQSWLVHAHLGFVFMVLAVARAVHAYRGKAVCRCEVCCLSLRLQFWQLMGSLVLQATVIMSTRTWGFGIVDCTCVNRVDQLRRVSGCYNVFFYNSRGYLSRQSSFCR